MVQIVYELYNASPTARANRCVIGIVSRKAARANPAIGLWDIGGRAAITGCIPREGLDPKGLIQFVSGTGPLDPDLRRHGRWGVLGWKGALMRAVKTFLRRSAVVLTGEASWRNAEGYLRLREALRGRTRMTHEEFAAKMAEPPVEDAVIALVRSEVARCALAGSGKLLPEQIYPEDRHEDDLWAVECEQLGFDIEGKAGVKVGGWFGWGDIPRTYTVEELVRLCQERKREDQESMSGPA
jgi:hypothetical protein